jgi:hypothetical protein
MDIDVDGHRSAGANVALISVTLAPMSVKGGIL